METLIVQFKQIKKQYGAKEVLSIEALSAYHGERIGSLVEMVKESQHC